MASGSGSALALAARLRGLGDDELTRLVSTRGVRDAGIRDFFDLAEALLDRTSVQAALQRLDRPTLAALAAAGELAESGAPSTAERVAARLRVPVADAESRLGVALDAALVGAESGRFVPWDAVMDQLRAWPAFGLPSIAQLADVPPPPALELVSESDARFVDRGAGDRAFGTLTAVTELLLALREEPARRLARGGIALPDARRLAAASGIDADSIEVHLDIAARAGLAVADGSTWAAARDAVEWVAAARLDRWRRLASGWLARLPDDLRELLRDRARAVWGEGLHDYVRWLYPAGGEWIRERVTTAAHEAELLGLTGSSTPSTPGAALLLDGADAAAEVMRGLFPAEVEQVYLQHDLTVIAPGPLRTDLDARLRAVADVEARGLASSFRFTSTSLTRALLDGATAEGIREFLVGISLTGIPQPLDYLITETASRFGSLRVGKLESAEPGTAEAGARSYVRSDDAALIGQIAVDHALAPLGLVRAGEHRLVSRFDAEVLSSSLADARYPVVIEDASGALAAPRSRPRQLASGDTVVDAASVLVSRVRAGAASAPEETGRAWLARQLELAIKSKIAVVVTVRLPGGDVTEYLLEPASLAGGRLRARDRRADIERTLPLASIVDFRPV